jgi:epoxide hydrolase
VGVLQVSQAGALICRWPLPIFLREIFCPPRQWAEALWQNLFYWNKVDKGGHFAAFEQPKLFVEEMRRAFKSQRG